MFSMGEFHQFFEGLKLAEKCCEIGNCGENFELEIFAFSRSISDFEAVGIFVGVRSIRIPALAIAENILVLTEKFDIKNVG